MTELPLITFALIAFNQAKFIREAVEGAFAQTYTPLEIVLSDDCSSDRTFEIMQEMAANYQGPHIIILNRNETNQGIGSHINRFMELSHGELIVVAAGDDISVPERTTEIYRAWVESGKQAFSLDSIYELIDDSGQTISGIPPRDRPQKNQLLHFSKTLSNGVIGATHAWHRRIFETFGPLPEITTEDVALPARSMLLGKVVRINKPLVKYRTHADNIWSTTKRLTTDQLISREIFYADDCINVCNDVVRCIEEMMSLLTDPSQTIEMNEIIHNIHFNKKKNILKKVILRGHPIIRLYPLLSYIRLYGLKRNDSIVVACAFSKTAYNLARKVHYLLKSRLELPRVYKP